MSKEEIKRCEAHIEMLLDKDEQTKIGINPDDVDHIRPLHQRVLRILTTYNELQAKNDRLKEKNKAIMRRVKSAENDWQRAETENDRLKKTIEEVIELMDEEPAKELLVKALKRVRL